MMSTMPAPESNFMIFHRFRGLNACQQIGLLSLAFLLLSLIMSCAVNGQLWPTCPATAPTADQKCFGLLLDCPTDSGTASCYFMGYWSGPGVSSYQAVR